MARYINTDLELSSDSELTELVNTLERLGLQSLNEPKNNEHKWVATLETSSSDGSPVEHIETLVTIIEGLDSRSRQTWENCSRRDFDIGLAGDPGEFSTTWGLPNSLLRRVADIGASLSVTVYRES
jgi:hypothetical protein